MQMLILNAEQQAALAALNETGEAARRLEAVAVGDGTAALNADLLGDCGPGQTWAHYGPLLAALNAAEATPAPTPGL